MFIFWVRINHGSKWLPVTWQRNCQLVISYFHWRQWEKVPYELSWAFVGSQDVEQSKRFPAFVKINSMDVVNLQPHEEMHDLTHFIVFIPGIIKPKASDIDEAVLEAKVLLARAFPNLLFLLTRNVPQQLFPILHVHFLHALLAIPAVKTQQKPSKAFTPDILKGHLNQPSIIHQ